MFEGGERKGKKVGSRTRKDMLKGAKSKRGDEKPSEFRLAAVKSSDKRMKKKEAKEVGSPNFLEKHAEGVFIHGASGKRKV
jgi:hypothetical protein